MNWFATDRLHTIIIYSQSVAHSPYTRRHSIAFANWHTVTNGESTRFAFERSAHCSCADVYRAAALLSIQVRRVYRGCAHVWRDVKLRISLSARPHFVRVTSDVIVRCNKANACRHSEVLLVPDPRWRTTRFHLAECMISPGVAFVIWSCIWTSYYEILHMKLTLSNRFCQFRFFIHNVLTLG